jgi:two-component system cell cycle sensor histidine kinase/response regulator CckA
MTPAQFSPPFPRPSAAAGATILAPKPQPAAPIPAAAADDGPPRGVILVVDDSAMIRAAVTKTLTASRYEVIVAENGKLGLAEWEKHKGRINLVLSDVFMPELDGLGMARELRRRARTLPIVLMSSKLDEDSRWIAEEAGFRLLPKPFKDPVLLEVISRLLRAVPPA